MTADLNDRLQRSLGTMFTIERELGGGGMARVFVARDHALGRLVVVKVLDLEETVSVNAERFRREVQMIATLQHPHIVPVLTAGGDDTLLWYVMPYVSGESLRARLVRDGALPIDDAMRIGRELFDALACAHDRGIVHRDVKPENILLEGRHAVVADFGVAKALADSGVASGLTSAGLALGTPAYMAPEQAMADPTANHRVDLYAAGAVLYETLAGAPPFAGNAQAVVAAHLSASVPRIEERRSDVPPALARLIQRLLAKNPAERPQSAHEALAILESVSTPTTATSPNRDDPAPAKVRRASSQWKRSAAFIIVLCAGTAGAAWWRSHRVDASIIDGTDVIAIMPLGSVADTSFARLGRELVVTLSTSLDGVGSLRTVDAMSVLQGLKDVPQPLRLQDARALAYRLGAKSVLHGAVTPDGGMVRLDMALYPVGMGDAMAKLSVRGSADSIRALTDTVTRQLLEQIWRRGNAPSPLLSSVATSSGDALRAFLAGEAAFEKSQMDTAIASYARAVALDSTFAQAWLRLDYSRSLILLPADTLIRSHLRALRGRLPQRERDWLDLRFSTLPFPQRLDSARAVAERYPESYAIQYLLMDMIVHTGPRYGIPIAAALPLLERLDRLSTQNIDVARHREMVADVLRDTALAIAAFRSQAADSKGDERALAEASARWGEAAISGKPRPIREVAALLSRVSLTWLPLNPDYGWYPVFEAPFDSRAMSDAFTDAMAVTPLGAAHPEMLAFARASRAVARGDVRNGVNGLAEFAGQRVPAIVRTSAAWSAATAAWFGLLPVAEAEAAIARVKPQLADLKGLSALDVVWAEGVTAIAGNDSAKLTAAIRAITDTGQAAADLPRQLRALWRERRTGAVDSLRAYEESAIRSRVVTLMGLPIRRAALGRSLINQNDAAGAERVLQWPDNVANTLRGSMITFQFGNYTSYERGRAADARGDKRAAIRNYNDFVTMMDRPPPAMTAAVADAKARLARLTSDAPRAR